MYRLTSIKRLAIAALAAAGVVAACRVAQPGEAPPLAPRPDIGPSSDPVPGAPDPLVPPGAPGPTIPKTDAGPAPILSTNPGPVSQLSQIDPPIYGSSYDSSAKPMQGRDAGPDAGGRDAGGRDAGGRDAAGPDAAGRDAAGPDAPRPVDAPHADAGPPPRDANVPDARDGGVGLPPVPDAQLPVPDDAVRPF